MARIARMSRSHALVVTTLAGLAFLGVAASCSFTTSFDGISGTRPADSGSPTESGSETGSAAPPLRPAGTAAPSGKGVSVWFGVKHYHFAHSNDALKVPGAWQDWGYDLDHLCTGEIEKDQAGSCIRVPQEGVEQLKDGKSCRDNNFGSQIVPQLNVYKSTFENDTNTGLAAGSPAWIFRLDDVDDGVDDPYVPGRLYVAGPTKSPAWDGTDSRDILPESVMGGDLDKPVVAFPKGYIRGNIWVSGEPSSFSISLPIGKTGELLPMKVVSTVIAFRLNETHGAVVDGTGVFAGAFAAADVETFLKPFILTQTSFCPGTTQYDDFVAKVKTFVDVVTESPTLQDPKINCTGISFGIGINLAPVARPLKLAPSIPPTTSACDKGDAGSDSGDAADGGVGD